jgi:hypothetical protein
MLARHLIIFEASEIEACIVAVGELSAPLDVDAAFVDLKKRAEFLSCRIGEIAIC